MAITFSHFSEILSEAEVKTETFDSSKLKSEGEYWNMKDPETGLRYDIPLLLTSDVDYVSKYISFMKLKEEDTSAFERILQWA